MSDVVLIPSVIVLAALVGSFLSVVADRVPRGASINHPPSACGHCDLRLGPLDLVPVFSWLALRGRCRRCRTPIGIDPLVIELANVAVSVAFAVKFGDDRLAALPAFLVFGSTLVTLSWVDVREKRLPREITRVGASVGGVALAIAAVVLDEPERIGMALLGAGIALALIGAVYLASNAYYGKGVAFGFGDVILAPFLGLFLGWLNPGIVAPGLFFGFVLGAMGAVPAIVSGKASGDTQIPFGPFLALGAVVAVFAGQPFVDLVLRR
jgi:leader peptidase (prepilin peptidase)/N-methyltransferase